MVLRVNNWLEGRFVLKILHYNNGIHLNNFVKLLLTYIHRKIRCINQKFKIIQKQ